MSTPPSPAGGGELFIVDNSDERWKGLRYLEEWTEIARAFDIASGYFEIGALLALNGLREQRLKVEAHIRQTYLRRVQAPLGVAEVLKCWLELH